MNEKKFTDNTENVTLTLIQYSSAADVDIIKHLNLKKMKLSRNVMFKR